MNILKKFLIVILLAVYNFSFFSKFLLYITPETAKAEEQKDHVNLVSILVDSNIYNGELKDDIQWYANNYIQQQYSDTKALITPINKDNFKAKDIQKVLENLYFEGQKDKPSTLRGTVLIGNLPLPVVNKNGYIFPSVYPYVNFENKKYIYDKETTFFEYNEKSTNKPDIWHGIIDFENNTNKYTNFFNKLKNRDGNSNFVSKKFWFEDFIHLKKIFSEDNLNYYVNNFVFFEDISFHRYTSLLFDLLKGGYTQGLKESIDNMNENISDAKNQAERQLEASSEQFSQFKSTSSTFFDKLDNMRNTISENSSSLDNSSSADKTPTLMLKSSIQNFFKKYSEVFSPKYFSEMRKDINSSGRWNYGGNQPVLEDDVDTHIEKVMLKDEISKKMLRNSTNTLEERLNSKIKDESYSMKIPVLENYEHYNGNTNYSNYNTTTAGGTTNSYQTCNFSYNLQSSYKNYYFGKYAGDIKNAKDFSIYRGTYKNITNTSSLSGKIITGQNIESINTDLTKNSIGSSYGIFSRQVTANRAYNSQNMQKDTDDCKSESCFQNQRKIGWTRRWWGGASPLNVDYQNEKNLKNYNYNYAGYPKNGDKGGWIYDIAASKLLEDEKKEAYSYLGYKNYSSLIKTNENYGYRSNKITTSYKDYFDKYGESKSTNNLTKINIEGDSKQWGSKKIQCSTNTNAGTSSTSSQERGYDNKYIYDYKLIDTLVDHRSPTSNQVNNMNLSTSDRPIDDPRYVTFKGVGGEKVKFVYPDLLNVEVYKKEKGNLALKNPEEIKQSLKNYLRQKVKAYNQKLQEQIDKSNNYYNQNKNAFDFLENIDNSATPNRSYQTLDKDFLIEVLGEELDKVSESLYYINLGNKEKPESKTILEDIENTKSSYDVNYKIGYILDNYLNNDGNKDKIKYPNSENTGYEAAYINSDGVDTISSTEVPDIINEIDNAKNSYDQGGGQGGAAGNTAGSNNQNGASSACTTKPMVSIFQWYPAFMCWWEQSKDIKFELTNKCSQGPYLGNLGAGKIINGKSPEGVFGGSDSNSNSDGDFYSPSLHSRLNSGAVFFRQQYSEYNGNWESYMGLYRSFYKKDNQVNNYFTGNYNDSELNQFNNIKNNLNFEITNTNINLENTAPDENNIVSQLNINSNQDLGDLNIEIAAIGESCMSIGVANNLCRENFDLNFNPYENQQNYDLYMTSKNAGSLLLQFKVCNENDVCYHGDRIININAGQPDSLSIQAPVNKTLKGARLPFKVNAEDQWGNDLGQVFQDFQVRADKGQIGYQGNFSEKVTFNNFDKAYFIYDSPSNIPPDSKVEDYIHVEPTDIFKERNSSLPSKDTKIALVNGDYSLTSGGNEFGNINYFLPEINNLYYYDNKNIKQLNTGALNKYTINLNDSNSNDGLTTPVEISTNNGTFSPGIVSKENVSITYGASTIEHPKYSFSSKTSFMIEDGKLVFYLKSNFKAGKDKLNIDIPGYGNLITKNIEVSHANPSNVEINLDKNSINMGDEVKGKVFVKDNWGNQIKDNVNLTLRTIGSLELKGNSSVLVKGGKKEVTLKSQEPGGKSYVYSKISGKSLENQSPDYKTVSVKNALWNENIKSMYVNLFGSDWGNKWGYFSDNRGVAQNVLGGSSKTLAVTTQMTEPSKIKKTNFLISPELKTYNPAGYKGNLSLTGEKLDLVLGANNGNVGKITLFSGNYLDIIDVKENNFPNNINENKIIYKPEPTDSKITENIFENNKVKINGITAIDFENGDIKENVSIVLQDTSYSENSIFDVKFNNQKVGEILIYKDDNSLVNSNYPKNTEIYKNVGVQLGFAEGTTNGKQGIQIYDYASDLSSSTDSQNSIENSKDTKLNIGFRENFKNISSFGAGERVGEATKNFSSEFLINYGDPVLKRLDKNEEIGGTSFDGSMGKRVFTDGDKNIQKTLSMDFNNDGLEDIVVVYNDGSIKLLKNYGGNNNYSKIGNIAVIADGIKNIFAGDTDGNGYDDLLIRTSNDKLRIYNNNKGKFGTKGKVACLDLPGGPDNIKSVNQIFFEDMDKDGKMDIITNDKSGDIKIFYGGENNDGEGFYTSTDNYFCDSDWKQRQNGNSKLVKSYGLNIKDQKIYDSSLIHWKDFQGSSNASTAVAQAKQNQMQAEDIDIQSITSQSLKTKQRVTTLPNWGVPSFENGEEADYVKSAFSKSSDPVKTYKEFTDLNGGDLDPGDTVQITVGIESTKDTKVSYLEKLNGAFNIPKLQDGSIKGFDNGNLNSGFSIKWDGINSYQFMVDNIDIKKGEYKYFSYKVEYRGAKLVNIDINKINNDKYPDIKVYPEDACLGGYWTFINKGVGSKKSYDEEFIDLQSKVENYVGDKRQNTQNNIDGVKDMVSSIKSAGGDAASQMKDKLGKYIDKETFDGVNFFQGGIGAPDSTAGAINNPSVNINTTLFNDSTKQVSSAIDDTLKGLCKGFDLSQGDCGGGLPVPFNMAFLSPGTFSAMGCGLGEDPGTPIFWFPGTLSFQAGPATVGPIPIPYGTTPNGPPLEKASPTDTLRMQAFSSMVRFYVSPTLTQQVGFAACFGPYDAGMNMPEPFNSVAGNCVVAANSMKQSCSAGNGGSGAGNNGQEISEDGGIKPWQKELAKLGQCENPNKGSSKTTSPFSMTSSNNAGGGGSSLNGFGSSASYTMNEGPIGVSAEKVGGLQEMGEKLEGGEAINLKIEGGDVNGLVSCIFKKWADKQIRYILNNLTDMSIYVTLPDISGALGNGGNFNKDFFKDFGGYGFDNENYNNARNIQQSQENGEYSGKESLKKGGEKLASDLRVLTPKAESLDKVSNTFSNPFEQFAQVFESVPLINIDTKDVVIKIPYPTEEEINKQISYLQSWVRKNEQVVNQWTGLSSLNCSEEYDEGTKEYQNCLEKREKYLKISADMGTLIKDIRQNIKVLQEWSRLPMELYKYVHIIDRYMNEIICILNEFLGAFVKWLNQNGQRFEKWADALIMIKGTIATWQMLIDFSVDWRAECSKCRNDNYDFYSCSLSLLCVDLPVLPIPPFKLPDIYLDFSHFRAGIDVMLPKFRFEPVKWPKIKLPTLPSPPQVNIDISLPTVPVLPRPPKLPKLPSVLPTIELEMPNVIPPAPKIPPLIPQIKASIQIADFIGQIYCIIKNGIGLVGENNVKTRIEQLTQRTYRVNPFDSLSMTFPETPLKGFDFKMDAYTNIRFSFDSIYTTIDSITENINDQTVKFMTGFSQKANTLNQGSKTTEDAGQGFIDDIDTTTSSDVDLNSFINSGSNDYKSMLGLSGSLNTGNTNYTGAYNMSGGLEYGEAKSFLLSQLNYLQNKDVSEGITSKAEKVENMVNTDANVKPNIEGVKKVFQEGKEEIKERQNHYQNMADDIKNNYSEFVEKWDKSNKLVSDDKLKETTIATNLFSANPEIIDEFTSADAPMKSYFKLNKRLLDGFNNTLNEKSASELKMNQSNYTKTKSYIEKTKNKTDKILGYNKNDEKLIAQSSNGGASNTNSNSTSSVVGNLSQYVKGLYVKGDGDDFYNVVNWEEKGNNIYRNNQYEKTDLNSDGKEDILMWDENNVYIKYKGQNFFTDSENKNNYNNVFESEEIDDISKKTDNYGFIEINGKKYKIWSSSNAVTNFERKGQSYESLSFSWNNDKDAGGYIVRLIQRPDYYKDKKNYNFVGDFLDEKYIVIGGQNTDSIGQLNITDDNVERTLKTKDLTKDTVSLTLENVGRQWQYLQVSKLGQSGGAAPDVTLAPDQGGTTNYKKVSPWSSQKVGGIQAWGDKQSPKLNIKLIREKTGNEIMEGNNVEGYINTNYKIEGNWEDNGGVYGKVVRDGINFHTGTDTLENVYISGSSFTGSSTMKTFDFIAWDQAGNTTRQEVSFKAKIPNVNVEDIKLNGGVDGSISASLSNTIDDGKILFQRNRLGFWQTMTGSKDINGDGATENLSKYNISYNNSLITGKVFSLNNNIGLFDSNMSQISTIGVDSGEIKGEVMDNNSRYDVYVDFDNNSPIIKIKDKNQQKIIFDVSFKGKSLSGNPPIIIHNGNYEKVDISTGSSMGNFKGGTCIKDKTTNRCATYVSTGGNIYVSSPYNSEFEGDYEYDNRANSIGYIVNNLVGNKLFEIKFKPKSLRK